MKLFELFGTISIENAKANGAIEDTAEKSEDMKNRLSGAFSKAGEFAVAMGKTVAAGIGVGAAAITALTKKALDGYADYEQLVGGIETLFGAGGMSVEEYAASVGKSVKSVQKEYDSLMAAQEKVMKNADEAYKTAGLSVNEYMETTTGMAAALISSLEGDTVKAADAADKAIRDMSDNANKMGSSMESIQNAYAGFSKQNYTMLDNLKLGYGGTKEEMARLLEDATAISNIEYDIKNYADIVEAIHVIQTEMGITGTTAKEASKTISGSLSAMKASWSNLVTGLGDENADMDTLINNFVDSTVTAVDNIVPRIEIILEGIVELVTKLIPKISEKLPGLIEKLLPPLIEGAVVLFNGLVAALPSLVRILIEQIPFIISQIGSALLQAIPQLIELGKELFSSLIPDDAEGQITGFFSNVFGFITTFWTENLKPCLEAIGNFLNETLVPAFRLAFETYIKPTVENVFNTIGNLWNNYLKPVLTGITDFLTGIFTGNWEKAWSGISSIVDGIFGGIKTILEAGRAQVEIIFGAIQAFIEAAANKIAEFLNFEALKANILKMFEAIKTGIKSKIEWARDKVDSAVRKIKSFLNLEALKNSVLGKFDALKNGIKEKIEWARDKIKGAIDAIKGFFNFNFQWPHIPMPHFSISPQGWKIGDLIKGSIPRLGIEWYAKGAVMKKPTIFDIDESAGKVRVGGEAGPEAVAPIATLQAYVEEAVANQLSKLFSKFETDEDMVLYAEINNYMDGKKMTSDIVETVIRRISRQQLNKQRAVGFV